MNLYGFLHSRMVPETNFPYRSSPAYPSSYIVLNIKKYQEISFLKKILLRPPSVVGHIKNTAAASLHCWSHDQKLRHLVIGSPLKLKICFFSLAMTIGFGAGDEYRRELVAAGSLGKITISVFFLGPICRSTYFCTRSLSAQTTLFTLMMPLHRYVHGEYVHFAMKFSFNLVNVVRMHKLKENSLC